MMSVARLEVVKGMKEIPHSCVLCGNNPVDEITGEQLEHIFAPGVDVDWGSSVYVCNGCAHIIADLLGRVTVEGFDKLEKENDKLKTELDKSQKALAKAKGLLERVAEGRKAEREVKREVKA